MLHSFPRRQLASILLFFYGGLAAFAQTWNGTTVPSGNWNVAQNWTPTLPANDGTANVLFQYSDLIRNANLNVDWNISSLSFAGFRSDTLSILGSGTLTIQSGISQTATTPTFTYIPVVNIAANVSVPVMQTWNMATESIISGRISGNGGFTKTGAGVLNLSPQNTYLGGTIVQQGTVSIADDSALGAATGLLQLNGGTVRIVSSFPNYTQGFTLGRDIVLGSGGGTISTVRNLDIPVQISGTGPLIISQPASGSGVTIALSGVNTSTGGLQLTSDSTYVYGQFLVSCLGNTQSLGNGPVTLSPGTLLAIAAQSNVGPAKAINIGPGSALIVPNDTIDPSQVVSAAATQGALLLSSQSYNRALNLQAIGDGTIFLGSGSAQPVVYAAATLQPGAGNKYRLGSSLLHDASALVISGHSNVLTGTASLLVAGQVELLNANNFSGGTVLTSGVLWVGDDHAVGSGTVTLNGGTLSPILGTVTLGNNLLLTAPSTLNGNLLLNGALNLNGGGSTLTLNGTTTFNNAIGNGTFSLVGSGTAVLTGANTFSSLQVIKATVRVSTVANLGGPTTPVTLQGEEYTPDIYYPGTLATTANLSLSNPILPTVGGLDVSNGTTLTLTQSMPGGTIYKMGAGTLVLSSAATYPIFLHVTNGLLLSSGSSLSGGFVDIRPGGTFAGSGKINGLQLYGGIFAPGGGTGIVDSEIVFSSSVNLSDLRFGFSVNGSPNYANVASSGNGLLALTDTNSGQITPIQGVVSIFLSAPSAQFGDSFKGAFYLKSNFSLISSLLEGVNFQYYALSPTGSTIFNGQTYTLLDPAQFALTRAWVDETASIGGGQAINGKVLKFTVAVPAAPLQTSGSLLPTARLYQQYSTTLLASGAPNPEFAIVAGALPSGLYLNRGGEISGWPNSDIGTFQLSIQASNGIEPASTKMFQVTVMAAYADWAFHFGLSPDPSIGGPTASPFSDGVPNLLKYFCGVNPGRTISDQDRAALPVVGSTTENGHQYLTLTYRQSAVATGVTVALEATADLQAWGAVAPSFQRIVGTDPVTFDPIIELGLDVTAQPTEMIRLRVTLP